MLHRASRPRGKITIFASSNRYRSMARATAVARRFSFVQMRDLGKPAWSRPVLLVVNFKDDGALYRVSILRASRAEFDLPGSVLQKVATTLKEHRMWKSIVLTSAALTFLGGCTQDRCAATPGYAYRTNPGCVRTQAPSKFDRKCDEPKVGIKDFTPPSCPVSGI